MIKGRFLSRFPARVDGGTGIAVTKANSVYTISMNFASLGLTLPASGTLATLAGSETLTNKTISLGSNTLTGTIAQFNVALQNDSFATLDGAETLTNKTLTNPTINGATLTLADNGFVIQDNSDASKQLQFQASGIATGTTRTLTAPNANLTVLGTLARSAVAVSHTGNTSETVLATITVPANAMGANGQLHLRTMWSFTNSANDKTLRMRFNGIGGTVYWQVVRTAEASLSNISGIANRNATNSQVAMNAIDTAAGTGASTTATVVSAIDTTAAVDVVLTGQLESAGETITLEAYNVQLIG